MSDAIWIKTEPSVDGSTYVVSVEFSDDRAIVLTPERVLRYATTVLGAAQRAEYDAAVFAQMRTLVTDDRAVAELITDLREDRPPLDDAATAPLGLVPGVNREGKPFIAVHIDGKHVGQWDVPDARSHALHALETVEAAELDGHYFRALKGLVGLDENRARQVVEDIGRHRQEEA